MTILGQDSEYIETFILSYNYKMHKRKKGVTIYVNIDCFHLNWNIFNSFQTQWINGRAMG